MKDTFVEVVAAALHGAADVALQRDRGIPLQQVCERKPISRGGRSRGPASAGRCPARSRFYIIHMCMHCSSFVYGLKGLCERK